MSKSTATPSQTRFRMTDSKLADFRVPANAATSWDFQDAPDEVASLPLPQWFDPSFVTTLPHKLRFSRMPAMATVLFELKDGFIVFE